MLCSILIIDIKLDRVRIFLEAEGWCGDLFVFSFLFIYRIVLLGLSETLSNQLKHEGAGYLHPHHHIGIY